MTNQNDKPSTIAEITLKLALASLELLEMNIKSLHDKRTSLKLTIAELENDIVKKAE